MNAFPVAHESSRPLIVDLFAGAGGCSVALERAHGRPVDIAINHNPVAINVHRANHPHTQHYLTDLMELDPLTVTAGRPVLSIHGSPDCTMYSEARGGQPRDRKIRALSWVLARWAAKTCPLTLSLENVAGIQQWGPLRAKRDRATGRVVTLDRVHNPKTGRWMNRIADPGERVPVERQFLVPDPRRAGRTWRRFLRTLQALGYATETRLLCAADYGAPTRRTRLFLIGRRDGLPIGWPTPTHGPGRAPFRTAAECVNWSLPCPSIFERKKPLAEATLERIAQGIKRYILESTEPFIAPSLPGAADSPAGHAEGAVRRVAFLEQANTGACAHDLREPVSTITATVAHQRLVTATMICNTTAHAPVDLRGPVPTITTAGHHALVRALLAPISELPPVLVEGKLSRGVRKRVEHVAAFFIRFYSEGGQWAKCNEPLHTITAKDRVALVTVSIAGREYMLTDIGLRMLTPKELFKAQGFPHHYQFEAGADGKALTKAEQVRLVGNSVCPQVAEALFRANLPAHQGAPSGIASQQEALWRVASNA